MNLINVLLLGQPPGGEGDSSSLFIMIGLMVVVFWFFMFRPQSKRMKEERKFRESLDKGTRVVTKGGIHGKIAGVQESTVIIEVEGGNRLKVEKSAISMEYTSGTGEGGLDEGKK